MELPQVEEGITCDKAAFKAGGKAFLFVGQGDVADTVMLKLKGSLPEARELAASHPAAYKIGGHDWVTLTLAHGQPLPGELLRRWIEESYRLLVPKTVVTFQDGTGARTSKQKAARKALNTLPQPKKG